MPSEEAEQVSETLRQLYWQQWPTFIDFLRPRLETLELSPPLLIDPPAGYYTQSIRLFIIGKQTHTWYNERFLPECSDNPIQTLMRIYRDEFRLGLGYNSPFWTAVRVLEARLGIAPGCVVWSNLNKVDQGKSGREERRPVTDIETGLLTHFPVLKQEIALAVPDVVVFFTGPDYDDLLERLFPKVVLSTIHGFERRALARVEHPALPKKAFRSWHPGYLRRNKERWDSVLAALAGLAGAP
jgi:hypothetical protein